MVEASTLVYFAGIGAIVLAAQYLMKQEPQRPRGRAVTESMIDSVAVMLPQVDRDIIRRDLEQTRNIEATTSRLLDRVQNGTLPSAVAPTNRASTSTSASSSGSLLGHYKLTGDEPVPDVGSGWKSSREEREAQLKAKRQAMVLEARRRMKSKETEGN